MMRLPPARPFGTSLLTLLALAACQPEKEQGPIQLGANNEPGSNQTSVEASEAPPSQVPGSDSVGGPVQQEPDEPLVQAPESPAEPQATVPMDAGKVETMVMQDCARTEVTAVDTTIILPADIIFAVDTSGSMGEEAAFVQTYLNAFSQQIIESGVDARVILLSTTSSEGGTMDPEPDPVDPNADAGMPAPAAGGNFGGGGFGGGFGNIGICIAPPLGSGNCPDDQNLPDYVHIDQAVGSHDALNVFIDSYPRWSEHLRPESNKFFVVVTDDNALDPDNPNAPNNSASAFTASLEALDAEMFAEWSMNGVYSFSQCEAAAAVGTVFTDLVDQTMGVAGDLCLQDFQPVFDRLAEQIVANAGAEILCEWEVPAAVDGQTFSTELVDVQRTSAGVSTSLTKVNSINECAPGAWHFDDRHNPTHIQACPETCEAMQNDAEGRINVQFACETVAGCAASSETVLGGSEPGATDMDGGQAAPGEVACEWSLPEPEDGTQLDLANVNVRYSTANGFGVLMGAVTGADACAAADLGWYYDDPEEPTKILACPETCSVLTTHGITDVQALFGCETKPAIPRDVF